MSAEENKAHIREWVETAWNRGDLTLANDLYAADYVYHDPASPMEVRGPEGIKGLVTMYRAALPDIHFAIEDMISEGDKVVWRWTARATHSGTLMGIPATGKQVTVTGIVISRFVGGKWTEDYNNWDTLGLLQQLGVIPAPGQARAAQ
jgi:steroid delta-isomerase-like uncharacterized protein